MLCSCNEIKYQTLQLLYVLLFPITAHLFIIVKVGLFCLFNNQAFMNPKSNPSLHFFSFKKPLHLHHRWEENTIGFKRPKSMLNENDLMCFELSSFKTAICFDDNFK